MESLANSFEESRIPSRESIESDMDGWDAETFLASKSMFEGQGVVDPEMKENLVLHTQFSSTFSLSTSSTINMNSMADFDKRLSSLATGTNSEDLLIADLKVEKMESPRELKGGPESGKRARMTNLQSQISVCIVHGCNKDLSSSKEYYKRHKVCDIHSKTAVVIVNGARQRFCQQCSRFHILAEFDNGKRSCRKRLAGHNKRRRKPQLETHFDKTFYGTDLCRPSLFFSTYLKCNEPIHHMSRNTELLKFGGSPSPPLPHPNKMGKHNPSKYCPSSPLSVLELYAISNSSCAPSLLSAQSESSLGHSATQYPLSFNPEFRGILCLSSGEADEGVLPCGTPSEPGNALGANPVDLLQLSLHLQRVEHEKQSEQVIKLENGIYSNQEHLMY